MPAPRIFPRSAPFAISADAPSPIPSGIRPDSTSTPHRWKAESVLFHEFVVPFLFPPVSFNLFLRCIDPVLVQFKFVVFLHVDRIVLDSLDIAEVDNITSICKEKFITVQFFHQFAQRNPLFEVPVESHIFCIFSHLFLMDCNHLTEKTFCSFSSGSS